jgi:Putative Na+/H+ antiporter
LLSPSAKLVFILRLIAAQIGFCRDSAGGSFLQGLGPGIRPAVIVYLVPGFSEALKYVVMAGAVTGGGLTEIANAPNPADQSILASRFREGGISPLYLFLEALVPTLIAGGAFMFLPQVQ